MRISSRCALLVTLLAALLVAACAHPIPAPALGPASAGTARRGRPAEIVGGEHLFGWLINGDTEARHHRNVEDAARALRARGAAAAHVRISESRLGNATAKDLAGVAEALAQELGPEDQIVVYVTGHGAPEGIVLQDEKVLGRDELLRILRPLREKSTVFLFDGCFAGDLPGLLVEDGFHAVAMAPVAEGQESQCQLFAPAFWAGVELGALGGVSLRDVFREAMAAYNASRGRLGLPEVSGTYVSPLPEARTLDEIGKGCAVVELGAEWCVGCSIQRRELSLVDLYRGEGVRVFTIDVERGPLHGEVPRLLGREVRALPTLAFLKDGKLLEASEGARTASVVLSRVKDLCGVDPLGRSGARAALGRRLGARDPATRAAAIEALLRIGTADDELARAFEQLATSANPAELGAVVERLVEVPGFGALVDRLDAPTAERVRRAEVGSTGAALRLAAIRLGARDVAERVRAARDIEELAGKEPQGPLSDVWPPLSALEDAVRDLDAGVRRAAVVAFARILYRTDVRVAYWAIGRIASYRTPDTYSRVLASLRELLRDRDPAIRACAALMAGLALDGDLLAELDRLVASDRSPLVRRFAALGLSIKGDELRVPGLSRALDDPDYQAREAAIHALAWRSVGKGRDKRPILAAMARPALVHEIARAYGLFLPDLSRVEDPELFPVILRLFRVDHFWAPVALVSLGDPRVLPALLKLLGERDPALRKATVWALSKLPDAAAAAAVKAALGDPDPRLRKAARVALGQPSG